MITAARTPRRRPAAPPTPIRAGRRTIEITHPDRVLFPDDGITKGDVAAYYAEVAPFLLPHVRERPLSIQRFPQGIAGPAVFQKQVPEHYPDWIPTVTVPKAGGTVRHVLCNDRATLLYVVNQGCLTPHVWLSRRDAPRHPDRLVFDLDPSRLDTFDVVRGLALELHGMLAALGLRAQPMTTGSRGLHVVVPLTRRDEFDAVRAFAREVAEELVRRRPREATIASRKDEREGKVYVDVLRNGYAQTVVAPYAVRARAGAPVAAPLAWDEVADQALTPVRWTVRNVLERLQRNGDPWQAAFRRGSSLAAARRRLRNHTW